MSELQLSKWFSKVFLCCFEGFVKFWVSVKILSKIENLKTAVLSEISDFDHFLNIVISDLWVNSRFQNGILTCSFGDLKDLYKFEVESKFCQKLKNFMTVVLSEISDFDHFLNIVTSDLWVNCMSQNGILKSSYVDLKDLLYYEFESKFCQRFKISMTTFLSEISDFDHFLNIVISDLWVNCKCQNNYYSKVFFCLFEPFVEVWDWVKILSKI